MFTNPFLAELQSICHEAHKQEHDAVFGDGTSHELLKHFRARASVELGLSNQKKQIEANRLLLFAMHFPEFPDGKPRAEECPDFIIETPGRTVGVELRDVYVEVDGHDPLKRQEHVQDRIMERARDLYTHDGRPPLSLDDVDAAAPQA